MTKIKNIILGISIIFLTACNFGGKVNAIEDEAFSNYFFDKEKIPTVKVKVLNLTEEEIKKINVTYTLVVPYGNRTQIKKRAHLKNDGTFDLKIDYPFPNQQIFLRIGKFFYAGIYVNSNLIIEVDALLLRNNPAYMIKEGVKYLGDDGELNTYLNNRVLYKKNIEQQQLTAISEIKGDWTLNHNLFLKKHDSLYAILHKLDDEFIEQNSSKFAYLIKNERMSSYYADLCVKHWNKNTPLINEKLFERIKTHKPFLVSNNGISFYNYLLSYIEIRLRGRQSFKFDIDGFIDYSKLSASEKKKMIEYAVIWKKSLNKIAYDTVKMKLFEKELLSKINDSILAFETFEKVHLLDSVVTDFRKADILKLKLNNEGELANQKKIRTETVLKTVKTEWVKYFFEKEYIESIDKLSKINEVLKEEKKFSSRKNIGNPVSEMPFGAKLYKVDNIKAAELLANMKKAFKNKALMLEFWSVWCKRCLDYMPRSNRLNKELENEPIEFIYLFNSASGTVKNWKEKIVELEMSGTHIYIDAKTEDEFMDLFEFTSLPNYALITKEGNYKPRKYREIPSYTKEIIKKIVSEK